MKKMILLMPLLLSGCFATPHQTYYQPQAYPTLEGSNPYWDNFSQRRLERQDRMAEQSYRQQHLQQLEQQNQYVPYQAPSYWDKVHK